MPKETVIQKSLRDQIEVIFRRRWFLIIPVAGILGISAIISFVLPNIYDASSNIRVNDRQILDPLIDGGRTPGGVKDQIDALSRQIISWQRLASLADQFHMRRSDSEAELEGIVADLRKRIKIIMKDKDIIEVSFQDRDPQVAQQVVNNITNSFISDSSISKKQEARNTIDFIGEQLKIYRERLESSQRNFSTHKIDNDLRAALSRKSLLEGQLSNIQKTLPAQARGNQYPVVARLQERLGELEMELSRLMMDATEEHPRVIALREEIAKVKSAINAEIKKETTRENLSAQNPAYAQVEQQLKQVNAEIEYLQKRKQELVASNEKGEGANPDGLSEEELSTLETSRKVDEDIYRMLLKQIESAYVTERLQDSDKGGAFSVLEYARLPLHPTQPKRGLIMLTGLLIGALSGLGLVFLMEYVDTSFRTADDAKKFLKMQFLGAISKIVLAENQKITVIRRASDGLRNYMQRHHLFSGIRLVSPHIAKKVMPQSGIPAQVVIYHEPKCPVAEEFRILRTNVQGLSYESVMKTIMLTSSVRGEGKSTTSVNLAIAMANTGKEVLIVDADLRRGSVNSLLNTSQSPGLSDVLSKDISVDSALVEATIRNLIVLPCGNRPVNPSELLGSSRMETLLNNFKSRFDAVIIDTPPVLNLPDSSILGKHCDGVVLVVQAERTQREDVLRAHSMLIQAHSNIVGFAMTNVQYHIPKYVYDYLYGT